MTARRSIGAKTPDGGTATGAGGGVTRTPAEGTEPVTCATSIALGVCLTQMMSWSADQCQTRKVGHAIHIFGNTKLVPSTDTMPSASRISLPRLSPSSAIVTLHYQFQSAVESSTSSAGGTPPRSDDSDGASVYERAAGDPQYRSSVGRGFIYRLHQERPVGCSREENFGWARNQHEHKGLLRSA